MPKVNREELGDCSVIVPPREDQDAIIRFLDRETAKLDALIAKKQRLIELLQEKRTALISHAVTKGLDPGVPMKESGVSWIGEIPAHWTALPLGRLITSMCDGPFGSDMKSSHYADVGVRLIRLQNIGTGEFDDYDKAYITEEHLASLPGHDAKPGDLLIAGLGDENHPVGRACIVPESVHEAMVKADCFRLRLDQRKLLHAFAAKFLCSTHARYGVSELMRGATRSRMNLSGVARLNVVVPPKEEQRRVFEYLNTHEKRLDELGMKIQQGVERLAEYRTALISAAVTGKIDVRGEVE